MPIQSDTRVDRLQPHPSRLRQESPSQKLSGENDRLRLRANCLAAVAVLALLLIGGWAENGLVNAMRDSGTCYRPGRSHCAAVYVPTPPSTLMHSS
jgi:hypothetical protein